MVNKVLRGVAHFPPFAGEQDGPRRQLFAVRIVSHHTPRQTQRFSRFGQRRRRRHSRKSRVSR